MARAKEVARFLVHLAETGEEPDYLTHLRLQKLLYYVQGWSLALRNLPMFSERIEAWAHGPVVRELYSHFSSKGARAIKSDDFSEDGEFDLNPTERDLTRATWDAMKDYSATSLRKMTHDEAPWIEARQGVGLAERCEREITVAAMKDFFDTLND